MKFCQKKIKRFLLEICLKAAVVFTIVSVNTTCMGPGYQPKIPSSAEKYRQDFQCK